MKNFQDFRFIIEFYDKKLVRKKLKETQYRDKYLILNKRVEIEWKLDLGGLKSQEKLSI